MHKLATLVSAVGLVVSAACAQSDPGITTAVKSKLAADDAVKAYQIDVDTSNGVVTLTGRVDSAAAKDEAVSIARQTEGVSDVVDRIIVGSGPTPTTGEIGDDARDLGRDASEAASRAGEAVSDAAITAAVKSKMLADTATPGLEIDVDTQNGVVTLSGDVGSRAQSERAEALARETAGVTRVVNKLNVRS